MATLSLKPKVHEVLQRARASADGLKQGAVDVRAGTLTPPSTSHRIHRFLFALALPFTLLRLTLRDTETRAQYVRLVRGPLVVFFAFVAFFVLHVMHRLPASVDRPLSRVTNAFARVGTVLDLANPVGDFETKRELLAAVTPRAERTAEQERFVEEHADELAEKLTESLGPIGGPETPEEERARLRATFASGWRSLPAGSATSEGTGARDESSGDAASSATSRSGPTTSEKRGFWASLLSILGPLYLLEWVCIWILREHHDAIGQEVSARFGVPGGPPLDRARFRFDLWHWVQKLWRSVRFFFFVSVVELTVLLPFHLVVIAVELLWRTRLVRGLRLGHVLTISEPVSEVALFGTVLYWGVVFAIANSALAWQPPPAGWKPWYARVLGVYQRVPIVGWIARFYAWVLRGMTRNVQGPSYAAETAPVEAIAIMVGKAVMVLPGFYLLVRPFFGPAASHLLEARRAAARREPSET